MTRKAIYPLVCPLVRLFVHLLLMVLADFISLYFNLFDFIVGAGWLNSKAKGDRIASKY
jgi:hypothetical protein